MHSIRYTGIWQSSASTIGIHLQFHTLHTCTTYMHTRIHSQEAFCDHDIGSGHVLLQLCEEHMKEMGVKIVGHRLELLRQIDKLRNKAGFVSQATFINTPTLLKQ